MKVSGIALALVLAFIRLGANAQSQETDFESDLMSWHRLKRYAGYFTEGGRYRGGLYKTARNEEHEYYECQTNTTNYCRKWTMKERSSDQWENGECECKGDADLFCVHWTCPHEKTRQECDEDGCAHPTDAHATECTCDETDRNGRYCRTWTCIETGEIGGPEDEYYTCLEEDISGRYCFRWKGDVSSSFEIESSVCECVDRTENYCQYWECQERGLIRCAAHILSWCDLNIAIGVGGGFGLLFILWGFLSARQSPDGQKFAHLFCFFTTGCLPWTAGVLIWGGVRGLQIVAPIWIAALGAAICDISFRHRTCREVFRKARTVHPCNQDV